ncbi:hypothetical protein R1sor_015006 [Riccia sorocarpa]|uniref:Uncharacterized protein n=1 Tax=Riccia sorocarpa TaxID=122646 RepID=A0ABD3HB05_9MARC
MALHSIRNVLSSPAISSSARQSLPLSVVLSSNLDRPYMSPITVSSNCFVLRQSSYPPMPTWEHPWPRWVTVQRKPSVSAIAKKRGENASAIEQSTRFPHVKLIRQQLSADTPSCGFPEKLMVSHAHGGGGEGAVESAGTGFHRRTAAAGGDVGGKQGGGEGGSGGGGGGNEGQSGAGDAGKSSRLWALWLWYMGCLDSNPILTKAITSAFLTLFGDVFCQFVVENAEKLDIKRTCIMTLLGFALTGPTLHFWYLTLYKVVTVGGTAGVGFRLALDQFVFSPIFIAVFISSLMTLEGKSSQIVAKLKQDLWPACLANWKLWIPAQAINFMLVPQKLQVGFANIVALAWNTYMSYQSHKKVDEAKIVQMEDMSIKSS